MLPTQPTEVVASDTESLLLFFSGQGEIRSIACQVFIRSMIIGRTPSNETNCFSVPALSKVRVVFRNELEFRVFTLDRNKN